MSRCLSRYTAWCKWRAMARLLSHMHCPAGIPVTPIADAPGHPAPPAVPALEGLPPGGRGSADPALVGVGLAFLRRLNPFVVGGVERVHSRWVRRADRREGRGGDTRAPQRCRRRHARSAARVLKGEFILSLRRSATPGTAPLRVTSCRQGRGSSPPLPAVLDRLPEGLASEGLSFVGKDPFLQGHQLDFVPGSPSVRTAEV